MNLKIGIHGYKVGENSFGVGIGYLEWITDWLQSSPIILTPHFRNYDIDLLVLPGGLDIRNNEIPSFHSQNTDVWKQYFIDNDLDLYIEKEIPVFGICAGFQALCQKYGCKLTQHIYHEAKDGEHYLYVKDGKRNLTKFGKDKVSSSHHQGVLENGFNYSDLQALFYAEDAVIEAFRHRTLNIAGVQYHPEKIYDIETNNIIKSILK